METQVHRVDPKKPDRDIISFCAKILRDGGLVAFPTETVYGLGANALDRSAVEGIFKAKGRPQDNPIIVHVASIDAAKGLTSRFPPTAKKMCRIFWPGPLTLILPKAKLVPSVTTGGLDTIAIRMPSHSVALALIREAGVPVAAPSANASGRPSPTEAKHVIHDLCGRIDAIIDAGKSRIGVESTVLDLTSETPTVLRPGGITIEDLRGVMGKVDLYESASSDSKPRCPGMKYRHYAPKAPIILIEGPKKLVRTKIRTLVREYQSCGKRTGVVFIDGKSHTEAAATLYGRFRKFDLEGTDVIIAEACGEDGLGMAIMNRLRKAASKRIVL
jgi:L-threonylcarbamoyladenylate synthase